MIATAFSTVTRSTGFFELQEPLHLSVSVRRTRCR